MHDINNFSFTSRVGLKGKKWLATPLLCIFVMILVRRIRLIIKTLNLL